MYSSINGRSVPVISPRSTSHSILASPDDQYNSSDSDPEDYRRRREQSVASILSSGITSDEPSLLAQSNEAPQVTATVTEVDLDSESDPGDILYKPSSHRGKRRTSSSNGKSARPSSLQIPERTHRKIPHQPPPIPNRSTNPPRTTMLKFRSKIRVTGGVKLHRNKPGGRPLITCAADSLKINLSEAWRPDPSRPGSSRQFYLASYSNPSSATSSVASFECSINMHNYIPMFKPRRLVHPPSRTPPPPPTRTPKVCKPKFDWMYQRLLDGVDSDESEWSWPHESSDEESPVEPPIEQRLLHAVPPGTVRLAEWRAREDALVLQAHVSDWRSKVEACEENERRQTDLIAQSEAKRDILDAAQVAFKKPNRKSKSPKLKPVLNRAASHDRFVPHSVRYGTRVQVRQVGDEKSEVMKSARALAKGLGLSWGTRDYDEELRTSPPRQSRITRRRSTA
jgi:ribosomal protein L7/L12